MKLIAQEIGKNKKKRFADVIFRKLEKMLSKHAVFARAYTCFFKNMTLDEFTMVEVAKKAKVVNIGCGSLPHTLIILTRAKDWSFVGIDKDEEAVKRAKKMVAHYKLSERIDIQLNDGMDFDVSSFDLVVISHGVEPKIELLEKLGNEIQNDSIIVYRTIWKGLTKVYGKEPVPKNLKIVNEYDRIDGIRSLLLKRKK